MYTPKHFEIKDKPLLLSFMRQYSFALIISSKDNFPKGTHLPFLIEERGEDIFLISHMAKANDQWQDFKKDNSCLVVFSEPHAYISTSFYDKEDKVPTWNYAAIHSYGYPVIITGDDEKIKLLEKTISTFHAPDLKDFYALDKTFLSKMLKGIVAFEIQVTTLQGKFKMSQNRKENEKQNILNDFEKSDDVMKKNVAALIRKVNY